MSRHQHDGKHHTSNNNVAVKDFFFGGDDDDGDVPMTRPRVKPENKTRAKPEPKQGLTSAPSSTTVSFAAAPAVMGNDITAGLEVVQQKAMAQAERLAVDRAKSAPPPPPSREQQRNQAVGELRDDLAALESRFKQLGLGNKKAAEIRDRATVARSKAIAEGYNKDSVEVKNAVAPLKYEAKVAHQNQNTAKRSIYSEKVGGEFQAEIDCGHVLTNVGTMQIWSNDVSCGSSHMATLDDCDVYMARAVDAVSENDILALVTPRDFVRMQNGANLTKSGTAAKEAPHSRTAMRIASNNDESTRKQRFVVLDHVTLAMIGDKNAGDFRCQYERVLNSMRVKYVLDELREDNDAQMPSLDQVSAQANTAAAAAARVAGVTPGGPYQARY